MVGNKKILLMIPYIEQNGVVESKYMILMDIVIFMLHNFGLSNSYGDEALLTKNYF